MQKLGVSPGAEINAAAIPLPPMMAFIDPAESTQQEEEWSTWVVPLDRDSKDTFCIWEEYLGPLHGSDRVDGPTSGLVGYGRVYNTWPLGQIESGKIVIEHLEWDELEPDQLLIDPDGFYQSQNHPLPQQGPASHNPNEYINHDDVGSFPGYGSAFRSHRYYLRIHQSYNDNYFHVLASALVVVLVIAVYAAYSALRYMELFHATQSPKLAGQRPRMPKSADSNISSQPDNDVPSLHQSQERGRLSEENGTHYSLSTEITVPISVSLSRALGSRWPRLLRLREVCDLEDQERSPPPPLASHIPHSEISPVPKTSLAAREYSVIPWSLDPATLKVHQLVQDFTISLGAEANGNLAHHTKISEYELLEFSSQTARLVLRHVRNALTMSSQHVTRGQNQDARAIYDVTDNDYGNSDDKDHDKPNTGYHSLCDFIANSKAVERFEADLLETLHEPYERCVLSAVGENLIGSSGERLDQYATEHVAREISWVPTRLLTFSYDTSLSYSDRTKAFVESQMGETWNWWPLAARAHRLSPGYCRLRWIMPYGASRYVDLPDVNATALKEAIDTAPAFINIGVPTNTSSCSCCGDGKAGTKTGRNIVPTFQHDSGGKISAPVLPGQSSKSRLVNKPPPVTIPGISTATRSTLGHHVNQYLSMCVTRVSNQFVSIDCDDMSTDFALFQKMKDEYNRVRGRLRLYFSMWCYSHCEFVLFKKYGYHLGAPIEVNIFPKHDDFNYLFEPRFPNPAPPHGPISIQEFSDHYYLNDCPSFYTWARYQRRYHSQFNKVIREALESFPKKKDTQINMDDGVSELFYGLHARERRSAFRVAIYACLCNLPGVIFFFLWLFQWGHDSDLQNASQLLTLSLSLTLGFAAVVFGSRDSM